jgi:hypothetical protein
MGFSAHFFLTALKKIKRDKLQQYWKRLHAPDFALGDKLTSNEVEHDEQYDAQQDKQEELQLQDLPAPREVRNFMFQSAAIENLRQSFRHFLFPYKAQNHEIARNRGDGGLGDDDSPL